MSPYEQIDQLQEENQKLADLNKQQARRIEILEYTEQQADVLVSELYQVLGALDAPVHVLDHVTAFLNNEEPDVRSLLPFTTLAAVDGWISVEEFQSVPNEGLCWIVYKGRVTEAYHDHQEAFRFGKHSQNCYMAECISAVMPINTPAKPAAQGG